jgi:hypothetical protein
MRTVNAIIIHDLVVAALSLWLTLYLRFGADIPPEYSAFLIYGIPLFVVIAGVMFHSFGMYRALWRYASIPDLIAIIRAVSVSLLVFWLVTSIMQSPPKLDLRRLIKFGEILRRVPGAHHLDFGDEDPTIGQRGNRRRQSRFAARTSRVTSPALAANGPMAATLRAIAPAGPKRTTETSQCRPVVDDPFVTLPQAPAEAPLRAISSRVYIGHKRAESDRSFAARLNCGR